MQYGYIDLTKLRQTAEADAGASQLDVDNSDYSTVNIPARTPTTVMAYPASMPFDDGL